MAVDPVSLAIQAALMAAQMAMTASQKFEGPRLDDLNITTSDYGAPLNYLYGVRRFDGVSCIWAEPLREVKRRHKTKGGKFNEYQYFGTWAVAVADCEVSEYLKIFFDRNLIYDATGAGPISPFSELGDITQYMTFYYGTATQDVDPRMAATIDAAHGAGSTPAYRGVAYIVFKDVPLEKLGNRLPQVSVIAATAGAPSYPYDQRDVATTQPFRMWGFTYSPDGTRAMWGMFDQYEIWDVGARALMVAGTFPADVSDIQTVFGISSVTGRIYAISDDGMSVLEFEPDGTSLSSTISLPHQAEYCQVLQDATGAEWICVVPWNFLTPNIQIIPVGGAVEVTPVDWYPAHYLRDGYGDIWAVGSPGVAPDSMYFQRVVGGGGSGKPSYGVVTGLPATVGFKPTVAALHVAEQGHFVVAWDDSGVLMTIDDESFTVTQSIAHTNDVYNTLKVFINTPPGVESIWLNQTSGSDEISTTDLSTLRSISYSGWGANTPDGAIYDRVNHALLTAPSFDPEINWLYLDRVSGAGVTLQAIVEDVAARSGLDSDDIDASDLGQTVSGYSWSQGTGKAILEPLLEAYDSEARPHDFKIEFLRRGVSVAGNVPVSNMGAGGSVRYEIATVLDSDLPLKVSMTHADPDADQQPNTALAQRAGAATDSARELSLDATTLVLPVDEARQIADGYLRRGWMKAQTYSLSLTRGWSKLEPGDAYTLALDDVVKTAKLVRLEFGANGVLTTEWERYAPAIHTPTSLPGGGGDGLVVGEVPMFGYTKGLALDIPLARDADEGLILYLAAAPYSDTPWPGALFYRSDDGVTYDDELGSVATSQIASIGYTLSALTDALPEVWDRASSVSVKMFDGELVSTTEAEVANGANVALIGDEIVGFTTATLIAPQTYQLSGFLRGRRGTEAETAAHASGERFVVLSGLPRAVMGAGDVSDTIYVKPITNGGSAGFPQTLDPYTGASLKPYSPAHLEAADVSGDLVATWVRRTRLGGEWSDLQDVPLGEGSEAYIGQVLDGGGSVIRTISGLTSPTLTYTAAQQATDAGAGATLRVMQVSTTVGNGFPADISI